MDDLLKIEDLKISYYTYAGEVQSVRGVSFSVRKGETLAIVGESGCGKSVTAKSIMGLIQGPPGEIKEDSAEREEPAGTVGKGVGKLSRS